MAEKWDAWLSKAMPLKVGVIVDMGERVGGTFPLVCELVRQRYLQSGRLGRDVEFIYKFPRGAPTGLIENAAKAYHELCDEGALIVVGFCQGDNTIGVSPQAEIRKVPLITLAAPVNHLSEHVFCVPFGSIPEDALMCASWLAKQGCKKVTLTYDRMHHSRIYLDIFMAHAARFGLKLMAADRLPVLMGEEAEQAFRETVAAHRAMKPDGIVHMGTSDTATVLARVVTESGWDVPRIMNFTFAYSEFPNYTAFYEGWVGTSMVDDANPTMQRLLRDYAAAYPDKPPPQPELVSIFHDGVTAALEAVAMSSLYTPHGLKEGIEKVRMLPSAIGGSRNVISFGPHDHCGLRGADLMVFRRVKNGQRIMEGYYQSPD